jgi:hypothetical protein
MARCCKGGKFEWPGRLGVVENHTRTNCYIWSKSHPPVYIQNFTNFAEVAEWSKYANQIIYFSHL